MRQFDADFFQAVQAAAQAEELVLSAAVMASEGGEIVTQVVNTMEKLPAVCSSKVKAFHK